MAIDLSDMSLRCDPSASNTFEIGDVAPFEALARAIGERWSVLDPAYLAAANTPDIIYPLELDRAPTVWEKFDLVRRNIIELGKHFLCSDYEIYARVYDWRDQPLYWTLPRLLRSKVEHAEEFLIAPAPGAEPGENELPVYLRWLTAAAELLRLFRRVVAPTWTGGYCSASAYHWDTEPTTCRPYSLQPPPEELPIVTINGGEPLSPSADPGLENLFTRMLASGFSASNDGQMMLLGDHHDVAVFASAFVQAHLFVEQPPFGPSVNHPGAHEIVELSIQDIPDKLRICNPAGFRAAPHLMFARIANCSYRTIDGIRVDRTGYGRETVTSMIMDDAFSMEAEETTISNGTGADSLDEWPTILAIRQHSNGQGGSTWNRKRWEISSQGSIFDKTSGTFSGLRLVEDYDKQPGDSHALSIPYTTMLDYEGVPDSFGLARDFNVIDGPEGDGDESSGGEESGGEESGGGEESDGEESSGGDEDEEESMLDPYGFVDFRFLDVDIEQWRDSDLPGSHVFSLVVDSDFDPLAMLAYAREMSTGDADVVPSTGNVGGALDPDIGLRTGEITKSGGARIVPILDYGTIYKVAEDEEVEDWAGVRGSESEES